MLTDQQWSDYQRDGFLYLGPLLTSDEVAALCARVDDLALGRLLNPAIAMQLDTGGAYEELPPAVSGFSEATLSYRKLQGLETDPLFSPLVRHPLVAEICASHYGPHSPVSLFRAMVMNKPAGQGTYLPWHQDGGDVWKLDRDPLVTTWVALDPATRANGCIEVVPGTHRLGLLSTIGSTIESQDVARHCPPERVMPLEVESGHGLLLHNWLIHRSGINPTQESRRAFTASYMDGRTIGTLTGNRYPMVFGQEGSSFDLPYLEHLRAEQLVLRQTVRAAEEYAHSLENENETLRRMFKEVEQYALSLAAERARQSGVAAS